MTNETKNQPTEMLRDGALKAVIWRNEHEKNGPFFTVNFARTYTDAEGKYHDTDSLSGAQLLRLARLAEKAYDRVTSLRRAEKASTETAQEAGA